MCYDISVKIKHLLLVPGTCMQTKSCGSPDYSKYIRKSGALLICLNVDLYFMYMLFLF